MKRTLYAICALAMSLTAFAQKLDTPKGKLIDNMYRTSDSWVKRNWTSTEPGRYEGLVSKIVVGDDNCLYVYNPLSGLDSKSWLKLDKMGEGKYRANLPQVIYKDNNGDDDDDEDLFLGAQRGDLSACGGGEGLVGVGEDAVDQVDALGCGEEWAVLWVVVEVAHEGIEPGVGDADVVGADAPGAGVCCVAEEVQVVVDN